MGSSTEVAERKVEMSNKLKSVKGKLYPDDILRVAKGVNRSVPTVQRYLLGNVWEVDVANQIYEIAEALATANEMNNRLKDSI